MTRAIVFLDIDGVLNGGYRDGPGFNWHLPEAVDQLNRLTDALGPDTSIVVSSSWRLCHSVPALEHVLRGWGVKAPIVGATPIRHGEPRIVEILAALDYLALDPDPLDWFVILDDNDVFEDVRGDTRHTLGPGGCFHRTLTERGLCAADVDAILATAPP